MSDEPTNDKILESESMEYIRKLQKENAELKKQIEEMKSELVKMETICDGTNKIAQDRIKELEKQIENIKYLNRDEVEKIFEI